MDVLKKVPVREQDQRFVQQILKKYVLDIMNRKQWKKQAVVSTVKCTVYEGLPGIHQYPCIY